MINNYGELFREVRKAKKLSLGEVCQGIVSPSFLSKFERGESDVSLKNFYELLERLNLSINEFNFYLNQNNVSSFDTLIAIIKTAYNNKNIEQLKNVRNNEINKFHQSGIKFYRCNCIMIDALIQNLDKKYIVSNEDILFLSEFLFERENWNYYEVSLFGNSMGILNVFQILAFGEELIEKTKLFKNKKNQDELIRIILNIIVHCLEGNYHSNAEKFIKKLELLCSDTTLILEKTRLFFLKGIYQIKIGNIKEGEKISRKMILVMKELELYSLANNHEIYLNEALELTIN